MRQNISARLINSLQPRKKPFEVRDSKLPGFILRVQPTGTKTYYAEFGRGKRVRIGRAGVLTPVQARAKAQEVLSRATLGEDPRNRKPSNSHTLESFLDDEYAPWAIQHRNTGQFTVDRIKLHFGMFNDTQLSEIDSLKVEKWRTKRLEQGIARSTLNRDVAVLKAALSKAVEWQFLEQSPLEKLKLLKLDRKAVVRFLTPDEEARLRETLDTREYRIRLEEHKNQKPKPALASASEGFVDHVKPMILISINTGLRRGELFNLMWTDVDLERKNLVIHGKGTKSGITRHIPINTEAFTVLDTWKTQTNGYSGLVFPSRDGKPFVNVTRSYKSVLRTAGIEKFRWHDLRHHFASKLVMKGIDLNTVRELLGHSDLKMTLRYAHLAPEHKANAVEAISWSGD